MSYEDYHVCLNDKRILSRRSCPDTSQGTRIVECKNRHNVAVTWTSLHESHVPSIFWVEAISTMVFLVNRIPNTVLDNSSPYQLHLQRSPDYSFLQVFGCACFVHLSSH